MIGKYDDDLMRKAQDMVDSGKYDLLTNNCQHYADKLRDAYRKLDSERRINTPSYRSKFPRLFSPSPK